MEQFNYKESPSQIGRIMTNPRSKSEVLSETAKTRIEEKFIEDQFGVYKDFWTKEINKGNECEPESIEFMSTTLDLFGAKKNLQKFENETFKGTPDVIYNGVVYDVKTSWSLFTFPMFEDEIPKKDYLYQMQAYMDLTGLKSAKIVYVLTDATEKMIEDEVYKRCMREKIYDKTPELSAILEKQIGEKVHKEMTFGHVPDQLRLRVYELEYNPSVIDEIKERVELCQQYYNTLLNTINNRLKIKENV